MTVTPGRYPWITKGPIRRQLPPPRPSNPGLRDGREFLTAPCATCGWSPIGWLKRCAACLTVVPR